MMELPPLPETPKKTEITLDGETSFVISDDDEEEDKAPPWLQDSPTNGGKRSAYQSIQHVLQGYRTYQASQSQSQPVTVADDDFSDIYAESSGGEDT